MGRNCHFQVYFGDADAAVVAAVMCSEGHVKLRASEEPSLFDKTESMPGLKGPEPGEMLYLPILSDIEVTDFKGHSLGFGDVSDPHVSVGGIISGPTRSGAWRCIGIAGLFSVH